MTDHTAADISALEQGARNIDQIMQDVHVLEGMVEHSKALAAQVPMADDGGAGSDRRGSGLDNFRDLWNESASMIDVGAEIVNKLTVAMGENSTRTAGTTRTIRNTDEDATMHARREL